MLAGVLGMLDSERSKRWVLHLLYFDTLLFVINFVSTLAMADKSAEAVGFRAWLAGLRGCLPPIIFLENISKCLVGLHFFQDIKFICCWSANNVLDAFDCL